MVVEATYLRKVHLKAAKLNEIYYHANLLYTESIWKMIKFVSQLLV